MALQVNDVEIRLLSKILNTRSLKTVIKSGVKENLFHGDNKQVFKYVLDYYRNYGEVPHKKIVRNRFPEFNVVPTKIEPLLAIIDELREREQYVLLRRAIQEASEALPNSVDLTLQTLTKAVAVVNSEIKTSEDANWLKGVQDRIDAVEERERKQVFGIPTVWDEMNKLMLGFQDHHLITVCGRPGVGKSWWVVLNAYKAWKSGFNVLVVTKEMAVGEINQRLDAYHTRTCYEELRTANFKEGSKEQYLKRMKSLMKKADGSNTIYVSGEELSEGGVMSISTKIEEYNPDILFVDGVYLLTDDRGGRSKVEQLYNITRDMKRVAKRHKIPIIQTSQMGRGSAGGKGGHDRLGRIQWADSFGQDSDEVIELYIRPDHKGYMFHNLMKQREGRTGEIVTFWDQDTMSFSSVAPEKRTEIQKEHMGKSLTQEDAEVAALDEIEMNLVKDKKDGDDNGPSS